MTPYPALLRSYLDRATAIVSCGPRHSAITAFRNEYSGSSVSGPRFSWTFNAEANAASASGVLFVPLSRPRDESTSAACSDDLNSSVQIVADIGRSGYINHGRSSFESFQSIVEQSFAGKTAENSAFHAVGVPAGQGCISGLKMCWTCMPSMRGISLLYFTSHSALGKFYPPFARGAGYASDNT